MNYGLVHGANLELRLEHLRFISSVQYLVYIHVRPAVPYMVCDCHVSRSRQRPDAP